MVKKVFIDTETTGLTGPAILLQYAFENDPPQLHSLWSRPIYESLALIEELCNHCVIGFNMAFDWFQLNKIYNMFKRADEDWYPDEHIEELALLEENPSKWCLKPANTFDVMLHARKGPYQMTMDREDIRVKRIPTALAWRLQSELERRIVFSEILFARRKVKNKPHWVIEDIERDGIIDPHFKNLKLEFKASTALKNLAVDALGVDVIHHDDISIAPELYPKEFGFAPFCTAVGKPGKWNHAWPEVIKYHIQHWGFNERAREYAAQDIDLTRGLYVKFGSPEPGDDDSVLACMVGSVRWKGFRVDLDGLKRQRESVHREIQSAPTDPGACSRWLKEVLAPDEQLVIGTSTAKPVLQELSGWRVDCCLESGCAKCKGSGSYPHPAALRATAITKARAATKEDELYAKLLLAKRFHASFKVIGTLSSRMAGTDDLNPQGIKRTKEVRSLFTLADEDEVLCGGDFDAFEVSIAEAVYNDAKLREVLISGKKIHCLLGMKLFPGKTYDEIKASAGTDDDMYDKGKRGVFLLIYGGGPETMVSKGIAPNIDIATKAFNDFLIEYPGIAKARQKITEMFCSMRQPNGLGTKVEWHDPADYIASLGGFRRYFTLENKICKALFDLANDPPKDWRQIKGKVTRRDEREQTISGATQSALYGAAFGIQAVNLRAAANHEIQSWGALITKHVQRKIWDVQPSGIHEWRVAPLNIHDEILAIIKPPYVEQVAKIVNETVESFRPKIPLIKMKWVSGMKNWAGKGG